MTIQSNKIFKNNANYTKELPHSYLLDQNLSGVVDVIFKNKKSFIKSMIDHQELYNNNYVVDYNKNKDLYQYLLFISFNQSPCLEHYGIKNNFNKTINSFSVPIASNLITINFKNVNRNLRYE